MFALNQPISIVSPVLEVLKPPVIPICTNILCCNCDIIQYSVGLETFFLMGKIDKIRWRNDSKELEISEFKTRKKPYLPEKAQMETQTTSHNLQVQFCCPVLVLHLKVQYSPRKARSKIEKDPRGAGSRGLGTSRRLIIWGSA